MLLALVLILGAAPAASPDSSLLSHMPPWGAPGDRAPLSDE